MPPAIMAVKVGHYKGLQEQWVRWSDGMALFGANGAGKTNFLEALAILMGTRETVRLASRRLAEIRPGGLELLVQTSVDELPWAPNTALNPEMQQFARAFGKDSGRLSRIPSDAAWWEAIGIRDGTGFLDALRPLIPSPAVAEYLSSQCERPIVRYTLQDFAIERSDAISRRFTRTLVGVRTDPAVVLETKDALRLIAGRMDPRPAGQGFPGHVDLLCLPTTDTSPAHLEWLPRRRDWDEIDDHVLTEFRAALKPAADIAESLAVLFDAVDMDTEPHWWLHSIAARHANRELAVTVPKVKVVARGEGDADFAVTERGGHQTDHGPRGDEDALERLAAGQRRWLDEAFATAARGLAEFARRAAWQATVLRGLEPSEVAHVVTPINDRVRLALAGFEVWTSEALDQLVDAVETTLTAAARRELLQWEDEGKRAIWEAARNLSNLQPQLTVRVFDEPEAHLHPRAQRSAARALNQLRSASQNIVFASHSPHFLELASWQVIHVERGRRGTTVSPLSSADLHVGSVFARDLGLTRGELFTAISLLLIVEGEHDQLVLQSLYHERLHRAGVAIARMGGTNNLINVPQLDFIKQHLDIPLAVLLDYTRLDEVDKGVPDGRLRQEERKLRELRELHKACRGRQRAIKEFALQRPDIIAYLNEEAIRGDVPDFPSWSSIIEQFETAPTRPSFKTWVLEEYGVDLTTTARISGLLGRMTEAGLPAHQDLDEMVNAIVEFTLARR
ncbi:hypothetical protein [Micromonospora sp. NPDC005299]|uniref:ATP-dependent nuclease n=1 Tax=Micromonospora sp. NPDC005299 TaxID=3364231 RepID=UPI003679AFBE